MLADVLVRRRLLDFPVGLRRRIYGVTVFARDWRCQRLYAARAVPPPAGTALGKAVNEDLHEGYDDRL